MKFNYTGQTNQHGFTYLSLIIGMTILLIGVGFFVAIIRSANVNITIAKEQMAMATIAQQVAQVYLATGDTDIITADTDDAIVNAQNQGYEIDLQITAGSSEHLQTITITVASKIDETARAYVEPYTLVFYTPVIETP